MCETCLYNKNCQFIAKHPKAIITGCTAYKDSRDVVEVRHGEWVLEHGEYGKMMCSVCKKSSPTERKPDPYEYFQLADFYIESPYCPNCGAKMDGERKEQK